MKKRSHWSAGVDRLEREQRSRRARAHQHLDRVRNQQRGDERATRPTGAGAAAAIGLAVLLGIWIGDDLLAQRGESGWQVAAIEVLGAERLTAGEVAAATGLRRGDGYEAAEPRRIESALDAHAWIAEARATRLPGGTLVLGVRERQPLAVIPTGAGPLGVDVEGRPFAVLDEAEAGDLPRLRCAAAPPPGKADPRLAEAIRLAHSLPDRGLPRPSEVAVTAEGDPEGLVLRLPGLDARFVLGNEKFDDRVAVMAELVEARPAEVAEAAQVDLRFAGQAVLQGKADPAGSAKEAT